MTIDELIAALESATSGSLELSAAIDRDVMGGIVHEWPTWFVRNSYDGTPRGALRPVVHYTGSLDAALTLVPDGWRLARLLCDHHGLWEAAVAPSDSQDEDDLLWTDTGRPSAPLAACIAALRARKAAAP